MKKPNIKKQITEATLAIREIMQENLSLIAEDMIKKVLNKYNRLPDSQRYNAISDIAPYGVQKYKADLLAAFSVVASDALKQARKEIPKAKKVKLSEDIYLSEFDSLPPNIGKFLKVKLNLYTDTQVEDVKKQIQFQYTQSVDTTNDVALLGKDLAQSAEEYITGTSTASGSGLISSEIINETRKKFFTDEEVLEEVEAFQFVNGDPITEICQDLNGTIFAKDDPEAFRYWPPLHWNCKSYIVPILIGKLPNGSKIEALKPSKSSLDKQVQFGECKHG